MPLPSSSGVWSVLKNLDLGVGQSTPGDAGGTRPPPKPPKTNENSMIRALEPPGTSPERSGTAQDHFKACSSHPSAAQDRPVWPPSRSVRPPRRHVVRPGSSSMCPGSNSVCSRNTKIIEIPWEKSADPPGVERVVAKCTSLLPLLLPPTIFLPYYRIVALPYYRKDRTTVKIVRPLTDDRMCIVFRASSGKSYGGRRTNVLF